MLTGPNSPPGYRPGSEPLQLSVDRLPTWVNDGRGGQFRPVMCVVVGQRTGLCLGMEIGQNEQAGYELAGRLLARTLQGPRPAGEDFRVQVKDPELATLLRRRDELAAVQFQVVERLEAVDELMGHMQQDLFPQRVPSPLQQDDVSVERMRAFADACAAFHGARPWRALHDDDVIEVESPKPPQGMRFASVLGAGGEVAGIGFYRDSTGYDKLLASAEAGKPMGKAARWALMFHDPGEMPPEDADLWEEHGLPVAADDSAPVLMRYKGMTPDQRPGAAELAFVEGLCRALALTTEAECDAGRWAKTVPTFDGTVTYRLTIPHLLEDAGAWAKVIGPAAEAPSEPRGRAAELCRLARGQRSRREYQIIREALRLDPDCVEAHLLLAHRESDPAEMERCYRQAVEAGRRRLGAEAIADPAHPVWRGAESRPLLRAMTGLAWALATRDRVEEAIDLLAETLRLNPDDELGARYRYLSLLVATRRWDDARALVESPAYRGEAYALWHYSTALVAFKQGRHADADAALADAIARNPMVVSFLLDPTLTPPDASPHRAAGDESEAGEVAAELGDSWGGDRAAMSWLQNFVARLAPPRKTAKPKRGRGGGG